ncbi:MAG: MbnH family di-heme enzyme [Pseudomonadota bacterium]
MRWPGLALALSCLCLAFSVAQAQQRLGGLEPIDALQPSAYDFGLPAWAPKPLEPVANPTTQAKVELGRHLFYDPRLSRDGSMSCASCHEQARAFTDGRTVSPGVTGDLTPRNAMSLANVAYFPVLTWSNPLLQHLEQQALVPLLGQEPVELGMAGHDVEILTRLRDDPVYQRLFAEAFPEVKGEISLATVVRGLSAFQRTIISMHSPYDRYRYEGDVDAVSDAVIRGEALFFSERLECHHCHNGLNFADTVLHERNRMGEVAFHNTGLYNLDGKGAYPALNIGIAEITGRAEDMGRFRAPSLRNVALTAPYMHDGSIATLDAVIDHYSSGGRTIATGPNAGVGRDNPFKSSFVPGFTLTPSERADLLAFLHALTDERFLADPRFANPWPTRATQR